MHLKRSSRETTGSNPPPCHKRDLCLVAPDSTPPRFVNIQLVSFPPVRIFNKFLFNLQYFLHISGSTISTEVLNTSTLKRLIYCFSYLFFKLEILCIKSCLTSREKLTPIRKGRRCSSSRLDEKSSILVSLRVLMTGNSSLLALKVSLRVHSK